MHLAQIFFRSDIFIASREIFFRRGKFVLAF